MNYFPNQIGKVLEETLADFNSDDVKTTLRHARCFKILLPFFASSSRISPHSSVTLLHTTESRGSTEGPCDLQVKLIII